MVWKYHFQNQQARRSWYTKSKFCVLTAPTVRENFSLKPFKLILFYDWQFGVWGFTLTSCYRYFLICEKIMKGYTDNLACWDWFYKFFMRKNKKSCKNFSQDLIIALEYVIIRQWVKYTHYRLIEVWRHQSDTGNKVTHITCSAVNLCNHPTR